jgi:2-polyprenyl-6-methoxyphenol hydroxylase-like FAD-dependent oxidoreductase
LGQGAAQALEDVAALARHLKSESLPVALAGYVKERKRRAERVVARSRAIGRIAQTSNPVAATVRDALARWIPDVLAVRQLASILQD